MDEIQVSFLSSYPDNWVNNHSLERRIKLKGWSFFLLINNKLLEPHSFWAIIS